MALTAMWLTTPLAADDLERCAELWERLGREVITADYESRSLEDIVDDLSQQLSMPLRADWEALEELGLHRGSEATLRVEFAHATLALAALAQSLGDTRRRPLVEPFGEQIVLTSPAGAAAMRFTACYDIRDLISSDAAIEQLRHEPDEGQTPEPAAELRDDDAPGDEGVGGNDAAGEPEPDDSAPDPDAEAAIGVALAPPRPLTPGEKFAWLLTDHVDPDAWIQFGGNRASISERDGVLIISAPPSTHIHVRDALKRLRQIDSASITLNAAIVDLPLSAYQLLGRAHEAGSAALANAVISTPDSRILWRTSGVMTPGSPLVIESTSDGVSIALRLDASFDHSRTNLQMSTNLHSAQKEDRRSVQTTATIIEKRGSAIIELPAASPGPSIRLLVLVVRPG